MGRRLRRCGRAGKWVFGRVTEDRLPEDCESFSGRASHAIPGACLSVWRSPGRGRRADTRYYEHSVFDNGLTPDAYFYSSGTVWNRAANVQVKHTG
jgi:hypothetical protein